MIERVVVINDASIARGGATGLALLSARLLSEAGLAVTYVAGDEAENPEISDLGVEMVGVGEGHLAERSKLSGLTAGLYNRRAASLLNKIVAERDGPGVVYHLHGWSKRLSPAAFAPLRAVRERTVVHAHDFFLCCPNGGFMNYQTQQPCGLTAMSRACVTTHCDKRSAAQKAWRVARQSLRERLFDFEKGPTNILMIHEAMASYFKAYGFPTERLSTLRNPVTAFTTERVAAERNDRFFYVGRLDPEKGAEDLAAAAAAAGVPLTIVGDGPLREPLEKAYPTVRFEGWRTREEIAELIQEARALVMPSRYPEPFGLVAIEALQSGLPVIVSDTAFLADEIVAEGLGWSVGSRDEDAFAAALRRAANEDAAIETMSRRAVDAARHLATTPESWRDGLIAAYERALGGAARPAAAE